MKRSPIILFEVDDEEFSPPEPVFGLKLLKDPSGKPQTLFKHQVEAIQWMKNLEDSPKRLNMRGGILAEAPGLGKTCISASLCMLDKETCDKPNLVVCSKTVAYSWKNEIAKFFGDSCPFLYLHRSTVKDFDKLTYKDIKHYKIIITTYETVMKIAVKHSLFNKQLDYNQYNRLIGIKCSSRPSEEEMNRAKGGMLLFKVPWNRIIADESHRFANPESSTFYSMMCLWGDKKWNLSGTPIRNYSSDLYSQLRFNGLEATSAKKFTFNEYQRYKMNEFTLYKSYESAGISLPPIKRERIEIELEDEEKEIYNYFLENTRKIYNAFLVGSYGFSNVLTLFLRLRQLCVSPYTVLAESSRVKKDKDEEDLSLSKKLIDGLPNDLGDWLKDVRGTAGIESAKMKALVSLLKSFERGVKTLVFSSFKKVIDVASLALDTNLKGLKYLVLDGDVVGEERDRVLNRFRDPSLDYSVLFISYKVGSEGLTLVEAENVIHMENWWTPVVQEQAERRVWRIGQQNNVGVFNILVKDSIEEKIEEICSDKNRMIEAFKTNDKTVIPSLNVKTIGRMIRSRKG